MLYISDNLVYHECLAMFYEASYARFNLIGSLLLSHSCPHWLSFVSTGIRGTEQQMREDVPGPKEQLTLILSRETDREDEKGEDRIKGKITVKDKDSLNRQDT